MIKVSVIIPAYNAQNSIEKCIDSVLNQTLKEFELIIINDGSTDKTKTILKKYNTDKRIIIINKKNEGIGKARNDGIRRSSGEYITFVDSDDYIKDDMLESYYRLAKKYEMDLVTGPYYKVFKTHTEVFSTPKFKMGNVKTSPKIIFKIQYGPCAKLYKRSVLIDNNILFEEDKKYEDLPFVSKALLKSKLVGQVNTPYYYYVIHQDSETTTMDGRVFDILDNLQIIIDYYQKDYYLKDELNFLIIDKVTNYMLQQRVQKDKLLRNRFINAGYNFLNTKVIGWKNNKYYKKTSFMKRIIKNNKFMMKAYCNTYGFFKRI